ncbi:MAG: CHASE3 domain-containing protein [Spirochaetales bacterium]|nr:CHASE3 domain-containing protein [Spirochaetales bacterium]
MKLSFKIISTNLITILIFIAVCIVLFVTMQQLKTNQFWVSHTYEVIGDGEELLSFMVDQETGMRGFLATGNDNYLEPYHGGKEGFAELMTELQTIVDDNPEQVARLQKIDSAAKNWDSNAASVFIGIRREIVEYDKINNEVIGRMTGGVGKLKMDTFRAAIDSQPASALAELVVLDMINMETGLRGYIATRDAGFLEPYNNGKSDISAHLNSLNVSEITNLANDWIHNYAELQIEGVRRASEYKTRNDLNSKLAENIGKQYMDGIRADIADFVGMEANLLGVRNEAADRQRGLANLLILIGSLIASIIALTLSLLVTKSITKQIGGEPEEIAAIVQKVSVGDLNVEFDQRQAVGIYKFMKEMLVQLTDIAGSALTGSEQIASASEQLASGNQDLSNRTEQQASALEETSSAIEEMNSSIKSNADNTSSANQLSGDAVVKTEEGAKAVGKMIESMNEISESSNKIADIIEVITNIAFQTNLLALNASIEAARAGEQGKGFAVVAVEVRKLAKRSDKAAEEITSIIKNSNQKVNEGVDIASSAGSVLEEINTAVRKVTTLVSEISAASQEQLSSVEQIDKTLSTLDENTQKNAALVEEAASSTEELSAQAQQLNTSMQFFKLKSNRRTGTSGGKNQKKMKTPLLEESSGKPGGSVRSAQPGSKNKNSETYESFSDLVDEGEFDEF